jgi:enolase-phosphatase E1
VTVSLSALQTRAIVLDIEGTTTPIEFVYTVLFPYARAHAPGYLQREGNGSALRPTLERLHAEQRDDVGRGLGPPAPIAEYIGWLMDQDRKSPGLKALQGLVWREGFESGELHGEVYPDVLPALERWRAHGLEIYIYSSGSVLAQQLLFGSTAGGDLTRYLAGYFDTAVGPKTSAASYRAIAAAIHTSPSATLFISDVVGELDAAGAAGLSTVLCVRGRDGQLPEIDAHPIIRSFDEVTD